MKIGDIVIRRAHAFGNKVDACTLPPKKAKVIYIHPEGRFHTVEFEETGFRESYRGTALEDSDDI